MNRLLIVSNRLPVTVTRRDAELSITASSGGLATGLRRSHERLQGLWLGWPGDVTGFDEADKAHLESRLAELHTVPLYLSASELAQYYEGIANGIIWPCFHYLSERLPLAPTGWSTYVDVNQRFCDLVVAHYQQGDVIWVQDYQLMLVPGMLRQKLPHANIGFFLHIPFPAPEVFRILPWRTAILEGLLGADLIGFHTYGYLNNFAATLLQLLGIDCDVNRVAYGARQVRLGAHPMGIDAQAFADASTTSEVSERVSALEQQNNGMLTILGVDRLDYTKGIPRRLLAIERLLQTHPSLRGHVRFVQVAVPSRTEIDAYADFKSQVDELIGRINGAYSTLSTPAILYLYRSLTEVELLALYRTANVMLVTPLRDGMNLVAKEFIAARTDEDGVLVLSEFAGAAAELAEAIHVNPYDVDGVAAALHTALTMPREERSACMKALRKRVLSNDVHLWATAFIDDLSKSEARRATASDTVTSASDLVTAVRRFADGRSLLLLLDYDGTLVPFASKPHLATPDRELMLLLDRLCSHPRTDVHIVSGRARDSLEEWFARLPLTLHAEHGFWSKAYGSPWAPSAELAGDALERVRPVLDDFASQTKGSFVEQKTASLAWHYRLVQPALAEQRAADLKSVLFGALANSNLQVLAGDHVVEVRVRGIDKGLAVRQSLSAYGDAPPSIIALGDDTTDEDMFAALPPQAISVHVGERDSRAKYRVESPGGARRLLWTLVSQPR